MTESDIGHAIPVKSALVRAALAIFLFFAVGPVFAADIVVTAVRIRPADGAHPAMAEITLNGTLKIKEVEIRTVGGRPDIRFPEFISRRGRVYPQVRLLSRQAREAVYTALATGKPSTAPSSPLAYTMSAWKAMPKKSKIKAIVTLNFNDAVSVECKVIETKYGVWVAWPARRPSGGGKWIDQAIVIDSHLKEAIVADILHRYQEPQDKTP